MTTPALDVQTAHEVAAQILANLTGHHVTWHGDDYQVARTSIRRSMDGWPLAVDMVLADDTRGDSITVSYPVEARSVVPA